MTNLQKKNKMDWRKYEFEIFDTFKRVYPNTTIKFNQKIKGRFSKVDRQIDILIEGRIAGKKFRLVIDGKYYSKKIDVTQVDSFISMVEDIEAVQGILITSRGYSKAAINRAYYGPSDIELDILNFDELKNFQCIQAIALNNMHGAIIPAPFGWIVDVEKRDLFIATIYQRGMSFDKATKESEFIYINIISYDEKTKSIDEVLDFNKKISLSNYSKPTFEVLPTIERVDHKKTILSKILRVDTKLEEYSAFIDFEVFCVICVLFTHKEVSSKNIRKLEYVIERLMPIEISSSKSNLI